MRYEIATVRIGENMGPIDWEHVIAKDKPPIWREAEANPEGFLFNGRHIIAVAMYDGWPYWEPRPAVHFKGPICDEWSYFDSYSVRDNSIIAKK